MDQSGNLKLCDFGFSESTENLITKKKGTDNYMAPEIYKASETPYSGKPADIFAIGVILFIFMYGSPPFCAANERDHFYRAFHMNYPRCFFKMHPKVKQ